MQRVADGGRRLTVPEGGCFGGDVVHGYHQHCVGVEAMSVWSAAHGDVSHLVDAVRYQGERFLVFGWFGAEW